MKPKWTHAQERLIYTTCFKEEIEGWKTSLLAQMYDRTYAF